MGVPERVEGVDGAGSRDSREGGREFAFASGAGNGKTEGRGAVGRRPGVSLEPRLSTSSNAPARTEIPTDVAVVGAPQQVRTRTG